MRQTPIKEAWAYMPKGYGRVASRDENPRRHVRRLPEVHLIGAKAHERARHGQEDSARCVVVTDTNISAARTLTRIMANADGGMKVRAGLAMTCMMAKRT